MKQERIWAIFALVVIFALCGLVIASCSDSQPQAVSYVQPGQVQQAPVVVAQQHDHFWEDMALYHLMFGGNQTTVVHHYATRPAYVAPRQTVVNNTTVVINKAPAPAPSRSYSSNIGSSSYSNSNQVPRATSYSGSYSSRSSYSSYSSRSSYSGRR